MLRTDQTRPIASFQMIRTVTRASQAITRRAVLAFIKRNPGCQLFEINAATLESHHSWGTKSILVDLECRGMIFVKRYHHGRKIKPLYYATQRRFSRPIAYLPL